MRLAWLALECFQHLGMIETFCSPASRRVEPLLIRDPSPKAARQWHSFCALIESIDLLSDQTRRPIPSGSQVPAADPTDPPRSDSRFEMKWMPRRE